ncbi:MAG TPA: ROK family protein, partial [Pseudolysinimonas sp.]
MHAIGIDIGGTKVAGALVSEAGEILRLERRSTPAGDPGAIVDLVVGLIQELREGEDVTAAGVAAAG